MNPEEKNTTTPPATPTRVETERKPFKTLRTYQGDVDEILSKGKASATTIFVAEEKRREASPQTSPIQSDNRLRNKLFTTFSISLLFLGIITIGVVYYIRSTEKVALIQKTKALISFSKEVEFLVTNLTRKQLEEKIVLEKDSFKLPPNSVLYLNPVNSVKNPENILDLLKILAPNMPSSLSRSFDDKYMLGIYSFDTNEPFIIIKVKDYANSFSGMLSWEKSMVSDLRNIFAITDNVDTENQLFIDEELRNKDLRVLKDKNKKAVLLYSFIDRETLVITTNETIFEAIIGKYLISMQNR